MHEKGQIRGFSGPVFSALRLNTETYSLKLRIQSKYGKKDWKSPYMDIFFVLKR